MYATKTENSYSIALICTNVIKRTLKQYEILHNDDIYLSMREYLATSARGVLIMLAT